MGTRLEVRGYLLLIELQPGSKEREQQSPTGVHQTPPVLGEGDTHTALDMQPHNQATSLCDLLLTSRPHFNPVTH